MSLETVLFILRLASGGVLLLFASAALLLIWREYRVMSVEVQMRRRKRGRLMMMNGDQPTVYPLLPLTTLGRAPTNTIVLEDGFASADHALITLRGGQWWLEDRSSANGTLLNGEALQGPTVVSSGDVIGIGVAELKLQLD